MEKIAFRNSKRRLPCQRETFLLAIFNFRAYIRNLDNVYAEAVYSKAARGNRIFGANQFFIVEHFHCSSPAANLAGVMEDKQF